MSAADLGRHPNLIDLTGSIFARLSVIKFHGIAKDRQAKWLCRCRCGIETIVPGVDLRSGHTMSCGCLKSELKPPDRTKHGHCAGSGKTTEYKSWEAARDRCHNLRNKGYKNYGGRGIEFRFKNFEEFFAELGPKPSTKHTVDRIDNNGHYEVGNVRWATWKEQAGNRRPPKRRPH